MSFDERRRSERRPLAIWVRIELDDKTSHDATIENISRDGILISSRVRIAPGTRITITVADDGQGIPLTLTGNVVRTTSAGAYGVSFVQLDDAALSFVRENAG